MADRVYTEKVDVLTKSMSKGTKKDSDDESVETETRSEGTSNSLLLNNVINVVTGLKLRYDGSTDVLDFLDDLEGRQIARDIPDDVLFRAAPELFTGLAIKWFKGNQDDFKTWFEVKTRLIAKFGSKIDKFDLETQIRNRKQYERETISEYIINMVYLARKVPSLTNDTLLNIIKRNMLNKYNMALILERANSISELEEVCTRIERYGETQTTQYGNSKNTNYRDIICYNCGMKGHLARSCFKRNRNQSGPKYSNNANYSNYNNSRNFNNNFGNNTNGGIRKNISKN